jgi:hypothetical protein
MKYFLENISFYDLEKLNLLTGKLKKNIFKDFSKEFDAAGDWTEASWDQFKAKVEGWWNKGEVKTDEAI